MDRVDSNSASFLVCFSISSAWFVIHVVASAKECLLFKLELIGNRVLPTAPSFAISFVSEAYVSSFLAIERPHDRISPILWKRRNLLFQKPHVRSKIERAT